MTRIRVSVDIDAPRRRVWEEVRDLAGHVRWMDDAVAIRFAGEQREGTGTTYDCDTRIGPFRLTDRMEVTEWRPGRAIGIRHAGLVTGVGRISLARARRGRTRVSWDERLRFPLWLGGPLTGLGSRVVLRRIWKGNLANLRRLAEGGG